MKRAGDLTFEGMLLEAWLIHKSTASNIKSQSGEE